MHIQAIFSYHCSSACYTKLSFEIGLPVFLSRSMTMYGTDCWQAKRFASQSCIPNKLMKMQPFLQRFAQSGRHLLHASFCLLAWLFGLNCLLYLSYAKAWETRTEATIYLGIFICQHKTPSSKIKMRRPSPSMVCYFEDPASQPTCVVWSLIWIPNGYIWSGYRCRASLMTTVVSPKAASNLMKWWVSF